MVPNSKQSEVSSKFMKRLQKVIGCMQGLCETVKQVKLWTILAWICTSLYKIGNVGHQRELRFPLGIRHCHSLPPAC